MIPVSDMTNVVRVFVEDHVCVHARARECARARSFWPDLCLTYLLHLFSFFGCCTYVMHLFSFFGCCT